MKRNTKTTTLAILILLLTAASLAFAADGGAAEVKLAWDPPPGTPAGYKVYWGEASGNYTNSLDAGLATVATVPGLQVGKTYYFAATALYGDGVESGYSNEVSKLIPIIGVPGMLRITGIKVEGQLNFTVDQ